MKKLIFSLIVFACVFQTASAQSDKKFSLSIGPEIGFATGSFNETHSVGTGGTIQAEFLLQEKLKATATFGVMAYAGRSINIASQSYKNPGQVIIPLRIGAKYYLSGGVYAAAQLGLAFRSNYAPYSGTAFAYTPLILGYEFKTNSDKGIDASIKYDASSGPGGTIGAFGLRLAYIF